MRKTMIMALAVLIAGSGLASHMTRAQQPGTKRTDLQRHDLSAPGREVVQVRVDFDPVRRPDAHASGRRDHLCYRRYARIRDWRQEYNGQGRRRPFCPGGNTSYGEEHRHD